MTLNVSKIFLLSIALITGEQVLAQVGLRWARCYNGPANGWDAAGAIRVDDSGFVYVTGGSPGIGTGVDYTTIKYDTNGDSLWARRYNGPENAFDVARDIAVDDSGNVYVTGTSVAATIKYDRFGTELWVRRYGVASEGYRLLLDSETNVVIGGTNLGDFMLLKYDREGTLQWSAGYNGPASDTDQLNDMVLDSQGNIIVTGQSLGVGTNWDYATVKYSQGGDTLWVRRYSGPAPPQEPNTDFARAVAVDDADNVYVTGWSKSTTGIPQCFTIKYSPNGDSLWGHRYPSGGTIGYAGDDILYNRGFIYVVARANGFDDRLLKYDLNGNLLWSRAFVSNHTFATNPPRLAVDTAGNIYMTSVNSPVGRSDFIVLKYAPDGTRLWQFAYPDSGSNTGNNVYAIAVDKSGNVYLTGESSGWVCPGASYDYLTLKLSQGPTHVSQFPELPNHSELHQNYPNPFNSSTTIEFTLPQKGFVDLRVFDVLGKEVAQLLKEERPAGVHCVQWRADGFSSGLYLCRLSVGNHTLTRKLLLLR